MKRETLFFMGLVVLALLAGCASRTIVHMDGMPIPNFEYVEKDDNTGMKTSYILARYYKKYEGDEYMTVPEYLEAWVDQEIDPTETDRLILHIRVVNLKRVKYNVWLELQSDEGETASFSNLYHGQLSRKDFAVPLPIMPGVKMNYRITIDQVGGENIHEIGFPYLSYSVKGGAAEAQENNYGLYKTR